MPGAVDLDAHATLLDTIRTAQAEIDALNAEIAVIEEKKEPWQDVIDACTEQIKSLMGEAEEATLGGQPVATFKTYSRTTVDVSRLRADHAPLIDGYLRTNTSRRFRLLGGEAA